LADSAVAVIHCVGRRPLAKNHPKLRNHVVDFAALPAFPKVDDCYIVLGIGLMLARRLRPLVPVNYRAILAKDVAHALTRAIKAARPGVVTLMSGGMQGG